MAKKSVSKPATKKRSPAAGAKRTAKATPPRTKAPKSAAAAGKVTAKITKKTAKVTKPSRKSAPATKQAARAARAPSKPTRARFDGVEDEANLAAEDGDAEPPKPLVTPLTPAEIEEFRNMLLQKRAEILGDMNTLQTEALRANRQDSSGDLSTMPTHMADLGSDNYELEFTLGLIEGERAILKEIEEALERVRGGTYGLCCATGQPIGKARLKAKPWAKYCYEYTLAQERGRARGF